MSHNQDQNSIDSILEGDSHAFAVLIDRYKHMVFTIALKIVKNREDAEEVAQDVFVNAYKALNTYKGDAKFSTWLYRIAYYKSLDYAKKNKRKPPMISLSISGIYHLSSPDGPLDSIEATERQTIIRDALDQLPEGDSVLITLHYYDGMTLKEIASVMGITTNTAKVRLFRSRKRLADIFKKNMDLEITGNYENS